MAVILIEEVKAEAEVREAFSPASMRSHTSSFVDSCPTTEIQTEYCCVHYRWSNYPMLRVRKWWEHGGHDLSEEEDRE